VGQARVTGRAAFGRDLLNRTVPPDSRTHVRLWHACGWCATGCQRSGLLERVL